MSSYPSTGSGRTGIKYSRLMVLPSQAFNAAKIIKKTKPALIISQNYFNSVRPEPVEGYELI